MTNPVIFCLCSQYKYPNISTCSFDSWAINPIHVIDQTMTADTRKSHPTILQGYTTSLENLRQTVAHSRVSENK